MGPFCVVGHRHYIGSCHAAVWYIVSCDFLDSVFDNFGACMILFHAHGHLTFSNSHAHLCDDTVITSVVVAKLH